jgi:hypothetical protein
MQRKTFAGEIDSPAPTGRCRFQLRREKITQ